MNKEYTLELTQTEFDLLKNFVPNITLQGLNAKDSITLANVILGLSDKIEKLSPVISAEEVKEEPNEG